MGASWPSCPKRSALNKGVRTILSTQYESQHPCYLLHLHSRPPMVKCKWCWDELSFLSLSHTMECKRCLRHTRCLGSHTDQLLCWHDTLWWGRNQEVKTRTKPKPLTLLTSGTAFTHAFLSSFELAHPWVWLNSHRSTQLSLWRHPFALVWSQHTGCHLLCRSGMDAMAGFGEQQQKWLTTEEIKINKCVTWLKESWEEQQEDVMMEYSRMKGIILKDAMPKMNRRKPRKGK